MISWLRPITDRHHKLIQGILILSGVASLVFMTGGNSIGQVGTKSRLYLGVDLNSSKVQNRYRDLVVFTSLSGQRIEGQNIAQYVAEIHVADTLGIPEPSDNDVRKIATAITTPIDGKASADGLVKFIEVASKQLNASEEETRARFETFIRNAWRVNKAVQILSGPGHVTTSQLQRVLQREKTTWTVEVATFDNTKFNPAITIDEAKVKSSFENNKESYRLPVKVEVSLVSFKNITPDTEPVSDDDIVMEGFNVAEKLKFEPGKVREQALAHRSEIEKIIRTNRAIRNLAGKVGEELADQFPVDTHKSDEPAFMAWIKKQNGTIETLPVFDTTNPPELASVPFEALKAASELSEKEWHTDMYRSDSAAVFVILKKRIDSRIPDFNEVKEAATANWKRDERLRLMRDEVLKISKAMKTAATENKNFADSASALGLKLSSPEPFTTANLPANLTGVSENTAQSLEVAGAGKIVSGIQTTTGDTVYIHVIKSDRPQIDASSEEVKQLVERFTSRNAYYMGMGLLKDLTTAPESQAE
jgi:hypothetical protein